MLLPLSVKFGCYRVHRGGDRAIKAVHVAELKWLRRFYKVGSLHTGVPLCQIWLL